MLSRPRLRSCFKAIPLPPRALFVVGERRQFVLEGAVHARLAPLLDGSRSLADLAGELAGTASLPQVVHAISQLEARGCLAEGELSGAPHRAAFLEALPAADTTGQAGEWRIAVEALAGLDPAPLVDQLRASDLELAADDGGAGLRVVVTDDHLRPELEALNARALERDQPWLLIKPMGLVPWIGPLFVPGTTGCWSCLAQRLRANRQMEAYLQRHDGDGGPVVTARAATGASLDLAYGVAVTELSRWLVAAEAESLAGRLLSLDLMTRRLDSHVLVRRPQCAACGEEAARRREPPPPVTLASRIKRFRADGGHRVLTPEETFERFKHHVSPITGAVTELRPALGRYDAELTPCFVAGHNFSMGVDSVVFLRESVRGMSGGKGASTIQAQVSGLCEAIERYSGIWTGEEYAERGRCDDLGEKAIHPNRCMGFSDEQYAGRHEWNKSQPPSRCVLVPNPFDTTQELDWSPAWSLTHQQPRLVPSAFCYYGHPEFAGRWCTPDSNGSAAGNVLEEAILQGFLEVVERDCVALWWYNRLRRRGVDLDSFGLSYVDAIREHYARLGRRIWVLDITNDLGICCLAAVSVRDRGPTQDLLVGFGAHFDPTVALLRAITEVNQFLPSVSQTRDDGSTLYLFGDELARDWWTKARLEELDYLMPAPGVAAARQQDFDDPSSDDLARDVETCVERARQRGLEVVVMDQTRPDLELSVVRVFVPDLCHFWRRLGSRRLYEVPVEMGWLKAEPRPEDLNPWTIFF